MAEIQPIVWASSKLMLLDQTKLPRQEIVLELTDYRQVVAAIREMRVRGAPALGVTAAYAMALAARQIAEEDPSHFLPLLKEAAKEIKAARPTAVNAAWAVDRLLALAEAEADPPMVSQRLLAEAQAMQEEDVAANRRIGQHGARLLRDDGAVLTHCNTGALATAGYGTALGVIRAAWEGGTRFQVYHTETRPLLQGARLTAWELVKMGIPATLVVDSAAGLLLKEQTVQCVIVGADRIAANGDTANKIGTYTLAVVARENDIPFYVAAPTSTVDLSIASGEQIPIEERDPSEVTQLGGIRTAAEGIEVRNPSFDVTPHRYIGAIITEEGIVREPYSTNLAAVVTGTHAGVR